VVDLGDELDLRWFKWIPMFIIDDYFLLMIAKFEDGLPLRDCNIQVEAATFIWCATRTLYYC